MADVDAAEAPEKETDENPHAAAEEVEHAVAMKQWNRAWVKERDNIDRAYEDLAFLAGEQWPEDLRLQREADSRPVLMFNRMGQFQRQVTGDMRQMRPSIKVVPCDDGADEKIAEIKSGLIRYIENRSDASRIYTAAADSQVAAGIGHWEVFSEYADDSTFEQELGVRLIDDQISVMWDPDAKHPTRRDAMWCFTPVDLTREAYKETYPDHSVGDLGTNSLNMEWFRDEMIRIARYWYKVKTKRRLMKMPNGGYEDLTDAKRDDIARMEGEGGEIVEKAGHKIKWKMMNAVEFISEPEEWPGRFIPVVPVIGEEVRVGAKIVRHGIVRFAADPQRAYNYARSTQTEFVGLQPKAPFIGTEDNFKDYENEWNTANVKNWPFLRYKPDPRNGNAPPQRQNPPASGSGLTECVVMAEQDMQAVIGIYNASLGAKSNETSGTAIAKREKQGDTGTFVYMDNFALSIMHTARILNDLLPHYYDTSRTVRVIGVDGTQKRVPINQPQGVAVDGVPQDMLNDMTTGAYDVQMEIGPSYATKREEARDGITSFITAFPPSAPVLAPVMADLQDWPNSDLITELLTTLAPPQVQQILAQRHNHPPPQPQPPNPMQEMQMKTEMAKAQGEMATAQGHQAQAQGHAAKAVYEVELEKLKLEYQKLMNVKATLEVQAQMAAAGPPIDSKKLHAWIGNVDMALTDIDKHLHGGIASPSASAPDGSGNGGGGGDLSSSATSPSPPSSEGQGAPSSDQSGGSSQSAPETPPALPEGHYAALPGQGA